MPSIAMIFPTDSQEEPKKASPNMSHTWSGTKRLFARAWEPFPQVDYPGVAGQKRLSLLQGRLRRLALVQLQAGLAQKKIGLAEVGLESRRALQVPDRLGIAAVAHPGKAAGSVAV